MKIQLTKLVINRKIFILFIMSLFFYSLKKPFVSNNINLASNTYRIAFVFGTRPEVIKLIPLIRKIKENKMFSCITIYASFFFCSSTKNLKNLIREWCLKIKILIQDNIKK
jgi:hypothetical protein